MGWNELLIIFKIFREDIIYRTSLTRRPYHFKDKLWSWHCYQVVLHHSLGKYRGFSYSANFWDYKEFALWEIRAMGELFKYYLLIKRAPLNSQSPLFELLFRPRTMCIITNESLLYIACANFCALFIFLMHLRVHDFMLDKRDRSF